MPRAYLKSADAVAKALALVAGATASRPRRALGVRPSNVVQLGEASPGREVVNNNTREGKRQANSNSARFALIAAPPTPA